MNSERNLFSRLPPELLLLVCEFIPSAADLNRFVRTCRSACNIAEPILYRRQNGSSHALLWAIVLSGSGHQDIVRRATRITHKAMEYARQWVHEVGFNTVYIEDTQGAESRDIRAYATPFLVATALGSVGMAKLLLRYGASPKAMGFNISAIIPTSLRAYIDEKTLCELKALDEENGTRRISSLAYAFERRHEGMVGFLPEQDHEFGLVEGWDGDRTLPSRWKCATTLHSLAATNLLTKSLKQLVEAECRRFASHINYKIGADMAPLHVAITNCNLVALKALATTEHINLDVQTYLGRTPLLLAIRGCWTTLKANERYKFQEMASRLIMRGCDTNALVGGMIDETPLIVAIRVVQDDWETASDTVWPIVRSLIDHGARINTVTPQGTTAMHVLFEAWMAPDVADPKSLEIKIKELIEEFGANINIPIRSRSSMLGCCLGQLWKLPTDCRMKRMFQYLAGRGARLRRRELIDTCRTLMKEDTPGPLNELDMTPYGPSMAGEQAYEFYKLALSDGGSLKLVKWFLEWLPWPVQANDLIPDILFRRQWDTGNNVRNFIRRTTDPQIPWDATGQDLLHHMVEKLCHDDTYTEAKAIKDAALFISRGATTQRNPDRTEQDWPRSAVSWVTALSRERGDRYRKLEILLRRVEDDELGIRREDCSKYLQ